MRENLADVPSGMPNVPFTFTKRKKTRPLESTYRTTVKSERAMKAIEMAHGVFQAGIEAVHWQSVGAPDATDTEIMAYAREQDVTILTHDLDFWRHARGWQRPKAKRRANPRWRQQPRRYAGLTLLRCIPRLYTHMIDMVGLYIII